MHTQVGHRDRVKERFRQEGLDHFDPVHVLELLLFYAIPQKDTKPLARLLLDRFGSLPAVLEANAGELEAVPGVGKNISTYLSLITAAGRYYEVQKAREELTLDTVEKYSKFLVKHFYGRPYETLFLLCLDSKCKLLSCQLVSEGNVNATSVPTRKMVELALATKAATVIMAHNHPGSFAFPSHEDVASTEYLGSTLNMMGIQLADHVVVSDEDYISMAQSGIYVPEYGRR